MCNKTCGTSTLILEAIQQNMHEHFTIYYINRNIRILYSVLQKKKIVQISIIDDINKPESNGKQRKYKEEKQIKTCIIRRRKII